jgi:hypothetical protein
VEEDRHDGQERAVRNQSLLREVNERIETLSRTTAGGSAFHEFSCECADERCAQRISLTVEEYEYIRRIPTHFIVKPGHVYLEVERVVDADSAADRYEVVEKFGEAGKLAIQLDPRSR